MLMVFRFDNVWCHGDFIQRDTRTGQIVFLGRADGVLVSNLAFNLALPPNYC